MKPTIIISCNPASADMAEAELRRADSTASVSGHLADGVLGINSAGSFFALAEQWRQQPPTFIRHICPVQLILPITGETGDVEAIAAAVRSELAELVDPALSYSVQSRLLDDTAYKPFDINRALSGLIQDTAGAPLDVRDPAQIISVVIAKGNAFLGISLAAHNLSNWAGGVHRFAREKGQISRAEFKLLEALAVFNIELPARGIALDLGAAPGGWTRILRQKEQYVTAVDPAFLHPSLMRDSNVRHKQMTAEEYLEQEPDQFDLIVNDMRLDARDSARLMISYADFLYNHGLCLMTFKLPETGRSQVISHAYNILRQRYEIAGARQLFHNRSEITVYLRKLS